MQYYITSRPPFEANSIENNVHMTACIRHSCAYQFRTEGTTTTFMDMEGLFLLEY